MQGPATRLFQLSGTGSGGGFQLKGQQLDSRSSFEEPRQSEEKDKDGNTNAESGGPLLTANPPQERPHQSDDDDLAGFDPDVERQE